MIYFTAHTFKCVCHCIRSMFRVLGIYNFEKHQNMDDANFDWHRNKPSITHIDFDINCYGHILYTTACLYKYCLQT